MDNIPTQDSELLKTIKEQSQRSIPEAIFLKEFLPYFCGDIPITDEVLSSWYLISNNGFSEVSVINERGEVVGIVPIIFDRTKPADVNQNEIRSINYMIEEYNSMSTMAPNKAASDLAQSLANKYPNETLESGELKKQWEKLLNTYGKSLNKENKSTPSKTKIEDDDIEYD